jgi:hypothetical protein
VLKKSIKFKNLDGVEEEVVYYFHMNRGDVAMMEVSSQGGYSGYLEKIIKDNDRGAIARAIKELILVSVGYRDKDDAGRFIKTDEYAKAFSQTEAFSELYLELITDTAASIEFFKGVLPGNISNAEIRAEAARRGVQIDLPMDNIVEVSAVTKDELPGTSIEIVYDIDTMAKMPLEEFHKIAGTDPRKMTKDQLVALMMRSTRDQG